MCSFFDAQQHSLDPNSRVRRFLPAARRDFRPLLCRARCSLGNRIIRERQKVEKGFRRLLGPHRLLSQFIKFVLGACGINKYPARAASIMGDALLQLGTSADITTKGENRTIKYQFLTSLPSLRNMKIAPSPRRCSGACVYYIAMRERASRAFFAEHLSNPNNAMYGDSVPATSSLRAKQ